MATYATDFSEYPRDGSQPSDWTERWNTGGAWDVVARAGLNGEALRHLNTNTGRHLLSWDAIDADANRADVEILILTELDGDTSGFNYNRAFLRASGSAGNETAYFVNTHAPDVFDLNQYSGGGSSVIASVTKAWSAGQLWWWRFRTNGASLQAKFWRDGDAEPAAWDIDVTDTTISAAGWSGLGSLNSSTPYFYWLGVGTGGDTAPGPGSGSDATAAPAGVSATAATGAVAVALSPGVVPSGVAGTGVVGSVAVSSGTNVAVVATGVSGAGAAGVVAIALSSAASPAGVSATAAIGGVAVATASAVTVAATGVSATAAVGAVAITGLAVVLSVTGVSAALRLGTVTIFHWTEAAAVPGDWMPAGAANDAWTEVSPAAGSWS